MSETVAAPTPAPDPHLPLFGILGGFWQSRALAIAAGLEIADHLAVEPLHLDELANPYSNLSPPNYSCRRATTGSTRIARRAGM